MEELKAASPEEDTKTIWWVVAIWAAAVLNPHDMQWTAKSEVVPGLTITLTYILMCQEGWGEGSSEPKGPRIPAKTVCPL